MKTDFFQITHKFCKACRSDLPITSFNLKIKETGQRQHLCRKCQAIYVSKHYYLNKQKYISNSARRNGKVRKEMAELVNKIKQQPCMDCKKQYPEFVMDFDHRNPFTKSASVSAMIGSGRKLNVILEEIEKCDIVCSNCHRIRTYKLLESGILKTKNKLVGPVGFEPTTNGL